MMKRYPAYKESGIEWLGEIPAHWVIKKLKYVLGARSGESTPVEPDTSNKAYEIYGGNGVLGYSSRYNVSGNNIVVGRVGAKCGNVYLINGHKWISDNALVVNTDQEYNFLYYLLESLNLNSLANQTAQPLITSTMIKSQVVAFPPMEEQKLIADYLDHKTAVIDTLIAKKEQQIDLLQEQRAGVINTAVTKGLNPHAPLKDSGIPWISQIPAHWEAGALSYYARLETGATPNRAESSFWEGTIPWVKTGEVSYNIIEDTDEHISELGLENSSCKLSPPGTILMAMYGQGVTRGKVAILGIEATYNQACVAIHVNKKLFNEYLYCFFVVAYDFVRDFGNETSQMNLNSAIISKMKILVPSPEEQIEIVNRIKTIEPKYSRLIEKEQKAIELLKEYRTAVISAAVTGKIDVRHT